MLLLEQYSASPGDSGDWGRHEKAIATAVRVQERKATLSRFDTLPSRPSSHGFGEHHSAFFGETGLLAEGQSDQGTGGPIRADRLATSGACARNIG